MQPDGQPAGQRERPRAAVRKERSAPMTEATTPEQRDPKQQAAPPAAGVNDQPAADKNSGNDSLSETARAGQPAPDQRGEQLSWI